VSVHAGVNRFGPARSSGNFPFFSSFTFWKQAADASAIHSRDGDEGKSEEGLLEYFLPPLFSPPSLSFFSVPFLQWRAKPKPSTSVKHAPME